MTKQVLAAAQTDADVCNALQPPVRGCDAGPGLHIIIPPDFVARIALGQEVPGCTYSHLETDGSLLVSDRVQSQIAIPAVVNTLSAPLQVSATALVAKLSIAAVVAAQTQIGT